MPSLAAMVEQRSRARVELRTLNACAQRCSTGSAEHWAGGKKQPSEYQMSCLKQKFKINSQIAEFLSREISSPAEFNTENNFTTETRIKVSSSDRWSRYRSHDTSLPISRCFLRLVITHLVRVVREVDLVINLSGFVLDRLHFHMVRREFPLALLGSPCQPLETVQCDGVAVAGVDEVVELLQQDLGAVEAAGGEPEQLPAALLRAAHWVLRQLLHDLAVHLVPQDLLQHQTLQVVFNTRSVARSTSCIKILLNPKIFFPVFSPV